MTYMYNYYNTNNNNNNTMFLRGWALGTGG